MTILQNLRPQQRWCFSPARPLGGLLALMLLAGCHTTPRPGTIEPRKGDEIVVAGQLVHTGARVVLWMDPGGYDAYRVERRFSPIEKANWADSQAEVRYLRSPNRYDLRRRGLTEAEIERVRGGGWDLPTLQKVVDQFVIHYDVAGVSRTCFETLQDKRDLSVHFMLDVDGTIYQTLDLKERAWHATSSNTRSVGIEIANMGAYPPDGKNPFAKWYAKDAKGQPRLTIPEELGDGGVRTKGFVGHPARPEPVHGHIHDRDLMQYDLTPEQYQALTRLTATLCKVFPRITCDYPKDQAGHLLTTKLPDEDLDRYHGVLGHYHIQNDKIDPGPAFQWDAVIGGARALLNGGLSPEADATSKGHMRSRE